MHSELGNCVEDQKQPTSTQIWTITLLCSWICLNSINWLNCRTASHATMFYEEMRMMTCVWLWMRAREVVSASCASIYREARDSSNVFRPTSPSISRKCGVKGGVCKRCISEVQARDSSAAVGQQYCTSLVVQTAKPQKWLQEFRVIFLARGSRKQGRESPILPSRRRPRISTLHQASRAKAAENLNKSPNAAQIAFKKNTRVVEWDLCGKIHSVTPSWTWFLSGALTSTFGWSYHWKTLLRNESITNSFCYLIFLY